MVFDGFWWFLSEIGVWSSHCSAISIGKHHTCQVFGGSGPPSDHIWSISKPHARPQVVEGLKRDHLLRVVFGAGPLTPQNRCLLGWVAEVRKWQVSPQKVEVSVSSWRGKPPVILHFGIFPFPKTTDDSRGGTPSHDWTMHLWGPSMLGRYICFFIEGRDDNLPIKSN